MAKRVTLFVSMCMALFAQAQSFRFADSTAEWRILEHGWGTPGPEYFYTDTGKVLGEETLNGKEYQRIGSGSSSSVLFRRDSTNAIYAWNGVGDVKIYNFSAGLGDSITDLSAFFFTSGTMGCKVINVDSVNYHGWKKRMRVHCIYTAEFDDVWIDGVGSLYNHPILGGCEPCVADGADYTLLCYFEGGQLQYHDTAYGSCIYPYPTALNSAAEEQLDIYPNPATDVVTITLTDNAEGAQLELLNACGQLVRSWQPETTTGYLPIYNLPNGIYYLRLSTGDGSKATGKLVVLHP